MQVVILDISMQYHYFTMHNQFKNSFDQSNNIIIINFSVLRIVNLVKHLSSLWLSFLPRSMFSSIMSMSVLRVFLE